MALQIGRELFGIFAMALHPQAQSFQALQNLECVHWRNGRAGIAQRHYPAAPDIGGWPQGLGVYHIVVGGVWFVENRKALFVRHPVKFSRIDNHAANRCAVAADVFRQGVHNDVSPELEGSAQIRSRNGIVDNQRDAVLVCNFCQTGNINNIASRIAD